MQSSVMWYYFLLSVLEWMEFNIYNSIAPYLTQIAPINISGGFVILISFLFRPLGSIFFSQLERNYALKLSLQMMIFATIGLSCTPISIASIWMLFFKSLQAFSLGGSYGASYLNVYETEEKLPLNKRWINYKVSLLQLGWVIGCGIGKVIVILCRICIGNIEKIKHILAHGKFTNILRLEPSVEFLTWGWRIPFMISSLMAIALIINRSNISTAPKLNRITPKFTLMLSVFLLSCIEFVMFYTNAFMQRHFEMRGSRQVANTLIMCFQELIMIILFPLFGFITDKMNQKLNRNINSIILIINIFIFIAYGQLNSAYTVAVIGSIILSLTYVCLIPEIIRLMPSPNRHTIGPILNLGSIIGGCVQYTAELWIKSYGSLHFFVILAILPSLITLIILQNKGKSE